MRIVERRVTDANVLLEPSSCGTTAEEVQGEERRLLRAERALRWLARAAAASCPPAR